MMKENNVITIDSGERYLLLHNLEEIEGKNYYYAIGVKDDDSLDETDVVFFEVTEEDGAEYVEKVNPTSEIYKTLTAIEYIDSRIDEDPSYEEKLDEFVASIESQTSSN